MCACVKVSLTLLGLLSTICSTSMPSDMLLAEWDAAATSGSLLLRFALLCFAMAAVAATQLTVNFCRLGFFIASLQHKFNNLDTTRDARKCSATSVTINNNKN